MTGRARILAALVIATVAVGVGVAVTTSIGGGGDDPESAPTTASTDPASTDPASTDPASTDPVVLAPTSTTGAAGRSATTVPPPPAPAPPPATPATPPTPATPATPATTGGSATSSSGAGPAPRPPGPSTTPSGTVPPSSTTRPSSTTPAASPPADPCADGGPVTTGTRPGPDERDGRRWVTVGELRGACDGSGEVFLLRGVDTRLVYRSDAEDLVVYVVDIDDPGDSAGFSDGSCSEPCVHQQPVVLEAGRYRLRVEADDGPWEVFVEEYRRP